MHTDCLFCKIIRNESPSDMIYRDEKLVVFKDINPVAPVHLLIVPVRHIRSINDLNDEDQSIITDLIFTAKLIAKKENIHQSGYKLYFNVEKGGGQLIFHLHLHLIGGWNKKN